MQVLKSAINDSILNNAESMFYALGYLGTSMRELAKKVGISFSNLYRYFENKSDLYDALMQPYYTAFMETIARLMEHDENEVSSYQHIQQISDLFIHLIKLDRKKFVILMEGSQGTRYETVHKEMIQAIQERIQASLPNLAEQHPALIHSLAANLFNAILDIAKNANDDTVLRKNFNALVVYHLGGIQKLKEL
jgi:AcrR family transcriptional regulator